MTLPASGQIALSQVAEEVGLPLSNIGLGDSERAVLAGVTIRQVAMSDLHGKSVGTISNVQEDWELGDDLDWGSYGWHWYTIYHSRNHKFHHLDLVEVPPYVVIDEFLDRHPAVLCARMAYPNRSANGRLKAWLRTGTGARFYIDRECRPYST